MTETQLMVAQSRAPRIRVDPELVAIKAKLSAEFRLRYHGATHADADAAYFDIVRAATKKLRLASASQDEATFIKWMKMELRKELRGLPRPSMN